ncbi:bifunctional diguanylate cyclase/phosphodiesterase [Aliiroseovarius sp.]|uniref:bifunctional diguanylate cyclase/phosphodiesterase n=1 Tax=Aliiroseovarius sp. TaxID=1872442 RepID=UPI002619F68E|nr:bifunctional diguanylate cyclase/phosphodiesterase [Aliiroseovarius sp.]
MAATNAGPKGKQLKELLRTMLVGPQLAAFIPALTLGAFWYGGEGLLLILALLLPALFALSNILSRHNDRPDPGEDSITGLPGPSAITGIVEGDGHFACLVVALDDLCAIRTQHGAPVAETVMQRSADRLCTAMRDSDVVASLDIGCFGILIEKKRRLDLEAMIQLAVRLQACLSDPIAVDGTRVLTTASIGFSLPTRVEDPTPAGMLAAAQAALTEARKGGPGAIRAYTFGMRGQAPLERGDHDDLAEALETGQITPWFQPQVSTDTGELTGFEALARWDHPEKGHVAPATFLPMIARAGLMDRLGEVMLFRTLSALVEWDKAGLAVPGVAVNFSPEELRNPTLFDKVRWELDRFDIDPKRLTAEVLENVVAQSEDDITTRNIAALAKLGCPIDLDDFGTGHASIANIRRFDVNRIKIDRSFVTHVDTDRDQQNMVAAILTMAERLNLDTLAEGVESHGEHAMLAQLGCGHVQGYSIARPMPLDLTFGWISEHQLKLSRTAILPRQAG